MFGSLGLLRPGLVYNIACGRILCFYSSTTTLLLLVATLLVVSDNSDLGAHHPKARAKDPEPETCQNWHVLCPEQPLNCVQSTGNEIVLPNCLPQLFVASLLVGANG